MLKVMGETKFTLHCLFHTIHLKSFVNAKRLESNYHGADMVGAVLLNTVTLLKFMKVMGKGDSPGDCL